MALVGLHGERRVASGRRLRSQWRVFAVRQLVLLESARKVAPSVYIDIVVSGACMYVRVCVYLCDGTVFFGSNPATTEITCHVVPSLVRIT